MASGRNVAPVIIKKKKVAGGEAHHGGAWKVAYADFVTAMMAFFMLMWLLNATTEKQRKGIADFFNPSIPISRMSSGSDGMLMGESVFAQDVLPRNGSGAVSRDMTDQPDIRSEAEGEGAASSEAFREISDRLMGKGGESLLPDDVLEHVVTRVTDEGLVIEMFDTAAHALFVKEAKPSDRLRQMADAIRKVAAMIANDLAVEGHVAAFPVVRATDPAWTLSSERAFVLSSLLTDAGLAERRIGRVTAHGDREPVARDPMALRNNRMEVIFLR